MPGASSKTWVSRESDDKLEHHAVSVPPSVKMTNLGNSHASDLRGTSHARAQRLERVGVRRNEGGQKAHTDVYIVAKSTNTVTTMPLTLEGVNGGIHWPQRENAKLKATARHVDKKRMENCLIPDRNDTFGKFGAPIVVLHTITLVHTSTLQLPPWSFSTWWNGWAAQRPLQKLQKAATTRPGLVAFLAVRESTKHSGDVMPDDRAKHVPNSGCQFFGEVPRLFLLPHQGYSSGMQPLRREQEERPGPVEASIVSEMAGVVSRDIVHLSHCSSHAGVMACSVARALSRASVLGEKQQS